MSVAFDRRVVADVPLLVARPHDDDGARPLVLWHHGFQAESESHRAELGRVASLGLVAIGVDAVGHGARRWRDWDDRLNAARHGPPGAMFGLMLSVARDTAHEMPALVEALGREGLGDATRVSLVGISLGAFAAYQAAPLLPSLRAIVALLGDPLDVPASAFDRPALLSITAERDESVSPDGARRLHAQLGGRHRYLELAAAHHLMNADDWERAMTATMEWITRHA